MIYTSTSISNEETFLQGFLVILKLQNYRKSLKKSTIRMISVDDCLYRMHSDMFSTSKSSITH